MQNPSLLSQFIGGAYRHIELERYQQQMYIDMYGCQIKNNLPVYVETQLTKADSTHFEKVKNVIETIEEGIVIWIAPEFKDEYIKNLYDLLHFAMAKPVNLYGISFSDSYLFQLDRLNKQGQIEIWDKINRQQLELPVLQMFKSIEIAPFNYQGKLEENVTDPITTIKGANKYFLRSLKQRVPFFFNAHRSKANLNKRQIVFGAGRCGLDYVVCLEDTNRNCFFKLRLTNERHRQLYKQIKQLLRGKITYKHVVFNENEIAFSFPDTTDVIKRIQNVISQFEQVIRNVDPLVNE
jgi:hypothetical protein